MRPSSMRQQPGQAAQHRALAGAVRAEEGDDLAGLGRELDVELERAERPDAARASSGHAARTRPPPEEPVAQRDEHGEGHGDQHEAEHDGFVGVGLVGEVDGERHGLGAAGEVAGERDRGAELAERPGPRQHRAGDEAGADGRAA